MVKRIAKDLTVAGIVGFVVAKVVRRRQEAEKEKHHGLFHRVFAH